MPKRFFKQRKTTIVLFALILAFSASPAMPQIANQDRNPIIFIPGFVGSELINKKNGETVWFKLGRSKNDDLRLPISENLPSLRDDLVSRDILRSVKIGLLPRRAIYGGLIESFKAEGYEERSWDNPKATNAIYVFAYDWRRDNVETARLLIKKIEAVKRAVKNPNLKFDVVAHSMGGLVARYAAMYGAADLPENNRAPKPDWAGAKHFNRLILIGTPNRGSLLALKSLVGEFALFPFNLDLPFVQKITKFDFFTFPAMFQLLPDSDSLKVYDEKLRPVKIDLFDWRNWDKYGWGAVNDPAFAKHFSARARARAYFQAALERAKKFRAALNGDSGGEKPISVFLVGADCKQTLDAIVVRRNAKTGKWRTVFKAEKFVNSDGKKVTRKELKNIMFAPGDGMVAKRSLTNELSPLGNSPAEFQCEGHIGLITDFSIQILLKKLLSEKQ